MKVSTSLGPGLNKERGLENKKKKKMFSKPSTSVVLAALALVSCGKERYLSFPLMGAAQHRDSIIASHNRGPKFDSWHSQKFNAVSLLVPFSILQNT